MEIINNWDNLSMVDRETNVGKKENRGKKIWGDKELALGDSS
jgi:hypothetical protein